VITLKKLKWSNAFSYGPDNEVDFSESRLVQLLGKNGHGKSSIALVLEECLYNKNSKGIKKGDILNRYSKEKAYTIELDFDKDGISYKVKTTRGSTQTVKLFQDGVDVSSHTSTATYKQIEEILGLDHKTFTQLVYQSSSSSLEFLTATDTARKKFLIDLLNLGVYTSANEVFKEVATLTSKEVDKLSASMDTINTWLSKYNPDDMVELPVEEPLPQPIEQQDRIKELELELTNIASINKKRRTNNMYKEQMQEIVLDNTDYSMYSTDDLIKLEVELAAANKVIADGVTFNKKLKSLSNTCPTCNGPIDNSSIIDMCNSKARESADATLVANEKTAAIKSLRANLTRKRLAIEAQNEWQQYHSLYDPTMESQELIADDISSEIATLKKEVAKILASIDKVIQSNFKASAHNAKIKVLQEQEVQMRSDLKELQDKLSIQQDKLASLQILVKAFSTTGLVAYKIECLVKDLESITNEYLAELYSGRFQLSFEINNADKLNVVINDNGRNVDILALSSGERARVNVAALLGIRKLMQSLSNSRINLLILDETISNLDTEGKEKLIELLYNEENLNTIVVSHDYNHPLLEKISVVKENNISRIE
jgi:DNA repair exonuclease SbcCD ATPase subunit